MTEQTLGRRIAAHRKKLGLTQDALAEHLGVTAQAVSKWENDQSCPDIAMLPKLAGIFGTTTDELLGVEKKPEAVAVAQTEPEEPQKQWQGNSLGVVISLWLLLNAGIWIINEIDFIAPLNPWTMALPTALAVFGVYGMMCRFSFVRLGCALLGGYMSYYILYGPVEALGGNILLGILVVIIALDLLLDSLRDRRCSPRRGRRGSGGENRCDLEEARFSCVTAFGEAHRIIPLERVEGGTAEVNFGELSVDLSGCKTVAENCELYLKCAFGNLTLYLPGSVRAVPENHSAFGLVQEYGAPAQDAKQTVSLRCNVHFGEISIRYL